VTQAIMKKQNSLITYIVLFTLAQLAWFSLLALWIYWYVSNYILLAEAGNQLSTRIISGTMNVLALVSGLILLVLISVAMSLIFIYLTRQLNLTRMYDTFIANITHELKSPLSSIQLHLETLNDKQVSPPHQKQFVGLMLKDAERLHTLINSILDIAALEQKKLAYDFQVGKSDEVLQNLISEAISQFNLKPTAVSVKGQTGCECVFDQRAMKIVVNNLFDNAIKYSENPVRLDIHFTTATKYFRVDFTDNGIGIPDKEQKRIFNKFARIYGLRSPSVKGTGLGLYWVREIIRAHGGRVAAFSAGTECGSTFRIELPIYRQSRKWFTSRLLKKSRGQDRTAAHANK
jgi:two-component system phosphate regulon sensor histidine kinase PhoR